MLLSISILCFNNLKTTQDCISHLVKYTDLSDVEVILTDNGSTDGTLKYLKNLLLPYKIVIHHNDNLGFGVGHNEALKKASGKYFLALNNDMLLKDPKWLSKALDPFGSSEVALVGVDKTPCALKKDGQGYYNPRLRDYVEGSFMLGITEHFRNYGLFSPAIKMFVFEDSDVSLRFRQMGYKIGHVSFAYTHLHGVTQRLIDPKKRHEIVSGNQQVFLKRWKTYLAQRSFSNKLKVEIPTIGIGDILRMIPVLKGLRNDHPKAEITVYTKHPEVLHNLPFVSKVTNSLDGHQGPFDRTIRLDPNYGDIVPIFTACAKDCATVLPSLPVPIINLKEEEIRTASSMLNTYDIENPILVLMRSTHRNWKGRDWKDTEELIDNIKKEFPDERVITIGKDIEVPTNAHLNLVNKTSLRELFALVSLSKLVISTDNLLLHVSQAFNIPCICLFGATDPKYMYVPSDLVIPITSKSVQCKGCYQKKKKPGFNNCERKDEACMATITVEQVMLAVRGVLC